MGNSTVKLQHVIDYAVSQGVPSPLNQPAGYGTKLAIDMANDVMADLISERFNWKWNSAIAPPFYTNSWQQDYPQQGNTSIAWLEDADRIDINNTSVKKPLRNLTVRRQLSRTNFNAGPIEQICWMYNSELDFGVWPGAGVTFYPLLGQNPSSQNPIMSMVDKNGNLLIVTTFGTTGDAAPFLTAGTVEGQTVNDGSVVWTCVSPSSKGFRVFSMPAATGPIYKVVPKYQQTPMRFSVANGGLSQFLSPIPDDYEHHFRELYRIRCLKASPNPQDRQMAMSERTTYLLTLENAMKQGNKEPDAYAMLPASQVVECVYPNIRNPQDPSQPY